MIATILRIHWLSLRRDRVVLMMAFLLPITFFSIFATVFGQQQDPTKKVDIVVVDEDHSASATRLVTALHHEPGLAVRDAADPAHPDVPMTRAAASDLVRQGKVPVAIVLPEGFADMARVLAGGANPTGPNVQLLSDSSDPIAAQVVLGLLHKVAMVAMVTTTGTTSTPTPTLPVEIVDVMRAHRTNVNAISFYAAGVGVMFMLFSASGAGGTLLDEQDNGVLDRLLGSRIGMTGLLAGKWCYLVALGALQLTVMFVWGAVAFGVPLASHVPGFLVMTGFTAAAAAAFGLVLATLARSRQQLAGFSTILILTMSAIGGSMFPRYMMSASMQKVGLVTFNAWALEGFQKVFWRNEPLIALWPNILVLMAATAVFLTAARLLARRWERA